MNDSHGQEIVKGKPYNIYKYKKDYTTMEPIGDTFELMRNNVDNLAKWFAIQDENYILELFSKLPQFAKDKLLKAIN